MCQIYLVFGRGPQIYKNGLAMGVTIGVDAGKSVKISHLLVIMRVKLSDKIGLIDLSNLPNTTK